MSKSETITLTDLLARAYTIEREAEYRYADLADQMEVHNNIELAGLFRKLAVVEGKHAQQILDRAEGQVLPHISPLAGHWPGAEAPESIAPEDVHYLMTPHHALKLALAGEQQAEDYFTEMVKLAGDAETRALAEELASEEQEHVKLVEDLLERYPEPEADWDDDPDPPMLQE